MWDDREGGNDDFWSSPRISVAAVAQCSHIHAFCDELRRWRSLIYRKIEFTAEAIGVSWETSAVANPRESLRQAPRSNVRDIKLRAIEFRDLR